MKSYVVPFSILGLLWLPIASADDGPADPPQAENATSRFLGDASELAGVSLVLQQASPLFGGREYYVSGNGRVVIVSIRRSANTRIVERRFEIEKVAAESKAIFEKIRAVDLLSIPVERADQPRRTCANPPLFIIRNAAGQTRSLPLLKGAPTKEYESVLMSIAALMKLTRDQEPVHEGDYDATFVPKHFEWTAPILTPGKAIRWAPGASPAEAQRAEQEYLKKVQVQLAQLEKKRRADDADSEASSNESTSEGDDASDDNPSNDKRDDQ